MGMVTNYVMCNVFEKCLERDRKQKLILKPWRHSVFFKKETEGQEGSSADKGACWQTWQSKFNPQVEGVNSFKLSSDFHKHSVAHDRHTHTHTLHPADVLMHLTQLHVSLYYKVKGWRGFHAPRLTFGFGVEVYIWIKMPTVTSYPSVSFNTPLPLLQLSITFASSLLTCVVDDH